MLLSIIIPTLNEKQNVAELVPLLIDACTINDFEIIVVDSPDSSDNLTTLSFDCSVKIVKSNKGGRPAQMNFGASMAKGDILYFLHADVRPPDSFASDIKQAVSQNFDFGFFSYQFDKYPSPLMRINAYLTKKEGMFTGFGDQSLFIKHSVFKEINGFDENYCIMEDFEFVTRARKSGYKSKIICNDATISARKFETNSYLKVNLINGIIFTMYRLGYSPLKMQKTYKKLLNENYINN